MKTPEGLRQRWQAWWTARHPRTETWRLQQRNIYIVPTRAGLAFAATLMLLLVASINYQLNLGYALTFLLAGAGLASIHLTHGNLRGLQLHLKPVRPVFAGELAQLEVVLDNPGNARPGLNLGPADLDLQAHPTWSCADPGGQTTVVLGVQAPVRGRHPLPALRLETRYPFGLFRAWTVWRPAGELRVHPRPEHPCPPLPAPEGPSGRQGAAVGAGLHGELDELRAWRPGDPPRRVVWKKWARGGELVSRDASPQLPHHLWLDWTQTRQAGDGERRLSRVVGWILLCEQRQQPWGLRLPGLRLPPGLGALRQAEALDLLCDWEPR
ncbi:DUF58 domain-containing protein [Ideonella livida]|uniref:DUF58 domain-containing protein n=1 Tax=Ideonella livida TaxID=2707176 RepID=A0A7C9TH18_9BURK|nr:DUF58 domain-containing protein [Ideonella livida]NDY90078.1 DUF58 domain-containing protein [Ideonella livida]